MTPLVIANWKMNPGTAKEAEQLFASVKRGIIGMKRVEVVVCPPFVWLPGLGSLITHHSSLFTLGAQDAFWEAEGAFTGEISPSMLKALGARHVIIGHSERRIRLGETDEMVNKKIRAALAHGLTPIICMGEHDRRGDWSGFIARQAAYALSAIPASRLQEAVFVYEPVWAISAMSRGVADSPEDALSASIFLRKLIGKKFGKAKAEKVRILYGGSVTSKNVEPFISRQGIGGVLVGKASLDPHDFGSIVRIVSERSR